MFNAAFAFTLKVLHRRLRVAGMILRLYSATSKPFWCSGSEKTGNDSNDDNNHPYDVLDASLVDDNAVIFVSSGPRVLFRAIEI